MNKELKNIALKLMEMSDSKRREILSSYTSDDRCQIVEQMVHIRLEKLRDPDGIIRPLDSTSESE